MNTGPTGMSGGTFERPARVYWGCTTFGCERGFGGTQEAMPRDWARCPSCEGDLAEIRSDPAAPWPVGATMRVTAPSSDEPFVDPIRFLLDGLEVGSIAELRDLVERGRAASLGVGLLCLPDDLRAR